MVREGQLLDAAGLQPQGLPGDRELGNRFLGKLQKYQSNKMLKCLTGKGFYPIIPLFPLFPI